MDFSLIEKKVLIDAGVTVTLQNLVLANIRYCWVRVVVMATHVMIVDPSAL